MHEDNVIAHLLPWHVSVGETVHTTIKTFRDIALHGDDTVLIYGSQLYLKWGSSSLKSYSLGTGTEVSSVTLENEPSRIAVVEMDGSPTLAVSYA